MSRRRWLIADSTVGIGAVVLAAYWGLTRPMWGDFIYESEPALKRLLAGDWHGFLALSPAYGGSMVLRSPLLALGGAFGGLDGAYRLSAVGCVVAALGLALWLTSQQRRRGVGVGSRWLLVCVIVLNPATAWALKIGHPEEVLTAVLAIGALLAATRDRPAVAGLLLGLAIGSKQWAVLAAPLVLVASDRQRLRGTAIAAGTAAVLLAPLALASTHNLVANNLGAAGASITFHPQQIWWALGQYVNRPAGGPHSPILLPTATPLVAAISRPLILVAPFALAIAWWRRRGVLSPADAVLALALVLLLRCLLDPWNNVYYHVPFLLALATWETVGRRRAPYLSLLASALVWTSFRIVGIYAADDSACVFYMAWALPACVLMGWRSLRLAKPAFLGSAEPSASAASAA